MICDDCNKPLNSDPVLAIEFWRQESDRQPMAHSVGETYICDHCCPTEAQIVRWMWPLLGMRCDITPQDVHHATIVRHSGHRSKPVLMFSIFPFMEKPQPNTDMAVLYG